VRVGGGGGVSSHPWRSAAAAAHRPHFGGDGGVGISTGVGRRWPAEGTILHMKLFCCFATLYVAFLEGRPLVGMLKVIL